MKKILTILLLILSCQIFAHKYYVKNGGNDALTGLSDAQAWETISKVNGFTFASGDTICFKRGSTWRERLVPPRSNLLFTCYGTGAKPILMRSKNESEVGDWTDRGSNIWSNKDAGFTTEVANILFNGDSVGFRQTTSATVNSQGDWFYSHSGDSVIIFSTSNPATAYGVIECALGGDAVDIWASQDTITFDSICFKYIGRHGISTTSGVNNLTVKHCDFEWIGGDEDYVGAGYRLGNGIETYGWNINWLIEKNTFTEIFDAGFCMRTVANNDSVKNIIVRYNVFNRCTWAYEFTVGAGGTGIKSEALHFNNNTVISNGSWAIDNPRWAADYISGTMFFNTGGASSSDIEVKNNLFYFSYPGVNNYISIIWLYWSAAIPASFDFNYNLYYYYGGLPAAGINTLGRWNSTEYYNLTTWRAATPLDDNSITGDPLFTDSLNGDFSLSLGSPAINAGIDLEYASDYLGNTVDVPPSIGAFEFDSPNYYVDNTGTGDTLSTIAEVNALTSADTIFFKKGCTWRDDLIVPNHGIVFMTYGTGAKPKILGSTQAITFTDCGGNVWKSATSLANPRTGYQSGSVACEIHFVEADDSVKWGSYKADTASLIAEYDWTWLSNYVYVYSPADPDARYDTIEVPQRQMCIDLNNKQYLEFHGLELVYAAYEGITYDWNLAMVERKGLHIEDCKIGYIGGDLTGTGAGFGIDAMYDSMIVRNCEILETGRRGLGFHLYGSGFTVDNILVEENTFHDGYHTTGVDISVGSASYTGNVDSVVIKNNLFYDPPTAPETCHQIFIQNYEYTSDLVYVEDVYIYNNIFKTPKSSAVMLEGAESVYIYNNTFYNHNTVATANTSHIWVDANCDLVKIKNNLFYTDLPSSASYIGMELYEGGSQAHANIDADYNLYYRTADNLIIIRANGTSYYRTVSSFNSVTTDLGWETNSPNPADPLFINVTAPMEVDSLMIGTLSPAKDAGIGLGLITTFDYYDSLRDATPDLGSMEYNPPDYDPPPIMPSVTTTVPVARYTRLVAVGGSGIGDGGGTITAKGVCYSTSANPTTSDLKVSGGTGTGDFAVLCPATNGSKTYHYRAYVTNAAGTAYGADVTFTTLAKSYGKTGGKFLKYNGKILILH